MYITFKNTAAANPTKFLYTETYEHWDSFQMVSFEHTVPYYFYCSVLELF